MTWVAVPFLKTIKIEVGVVWAENFTLNSNPILFKTYLKCIYIFGAMEKAVEYVSLISGRKAWAGYLELKRLKVWKCVKLFGACSE